MYFYFYAPFFVWHRVELCRQHLIFSLVAKREEIFFSWVLSSLDCKLSCWKTTLSFLKTLFTTWLDFLFWESTFNIFWCQIFFSFFVSFVLVLSKKNKTQFLFHGERKNTGAHLFPFIEIKLSSRMVSLSQLSFQNWWKGKEIIRFKFTI